VKLRVYFRILFTTWRLITHVLTLSSRFCKPHETHGYEHVNRNWGLSVRFCSLTVFWKYCSVLSLALKCAVSEIAMYLGRSCRRVACWVLPTVSGYK